MSFVTVFSYPLCHIEANCKLDFLLSDVINILECLGLERFMIRVHLNGYFYYLMKMRMMNYWVNKVRIYIKIPPRSGVKAKAHEQCFQ